MTPKIFKAVKTALRISHDALDEDIKINIAAALIDLSAAGVDVDNHLDDEPIFVAVSLYCRWIYNQLEKGEEWRKNYEQCRQKLSLDSAYNKHFRGEADV